LLAHHEHAVFSFGMDEIAGLEHDVVARYRLVLFAGRRQFVVAGEQEDAGTAAAAGAPDPSRGALPPRLAPA
jgi:hypothetical protein